MNRLEVGPGIVQNNKLQEAEEILSEQLKGCEKIKTISTTQSLLKFEQSLIQ